MPKPELFLTALKHLVRYHRGSVLVMFVGSMIALFLVVGAAVDYSRAVQFKAALQNLADASALAGASAYVSDETAGAAVTVATNYWNAGLATIYPNGGVATPTITTSSDPTGYYVQVAVPTSTIKTTFLSLAMPRMAVAVSAKAKDPIVTASVDFGGWTSDAYDGNTIYWYKVPSDGSLPVFDTNNANRPGYNSNYHAVFTNIVNNPPPTSRSFFIAAAQRIGFAFVNVTGGRCPISGCSPMTNYGSNQYGGGFQSVHVFFSQSNPPNYTRYGYQPGPQLAGVACNATLITAPVNPQNPYPTAPSANTGSCQTATFNPIAAPSCAGVAATGGQSYRYFWNDMGAGHDDFDFNDGVYNFSCSTSGSASTGVILVD